MCLFAGIQRILPRVPYLHFPQKGQTLSQDVRRFLLGLWCSCASMQRFPPTAWAVSSRILAIPCKQPASCFVFVLSSFHARSCPRVIYFVSCIVSRLSDELYTYAHHLDTGDILGKIPQKSKFCFKIKLRNKTQHIQGARKYCDDQILNPLRNEKKLWVIRK